MGRTAEKDIGTISRLHFQIEIPWKKYTRLASGCETEQTIRRMKELIELLEEKIRTKPTGALTPLDGIFVLLQQMLKEKQEEKAILKEIKEKLDNFTD